MLVDVNKLLLAKIEKAKIFGFFYSAKKQTSPQCFPIMMRAN